MKSKLLILILSVFTMSAIGQEFEKGTIITQRYDTIANVQIKVLNDSKCLTHLTYIDSNGQEQSPGIESIKCYSRGETVFCRIYNEGEMIMVKRITEGNKLNLYVKDVNGIKSYYIEKVYDECIKVPSSTSKFKKVLGEFLSAAPQIATKINSEELTDIEEIVTLYNQG